MTMSPDSGFEKCAFPGCFRTRDLRLLVTESGRFKLCQEHYEQVAQRSLTAFMPKLSKVAVLFGSFLAVKSCANGLQRPMPAHGKGPCFWRCKVLASVALGWLVSYFALVSMEVCP